MPVDFGAIVSRRLATAALRVPPDVLARLIAYLELLARWNRRINLTAFDLDRPSDDAIDRLIVEPVAAARTIRPTDRLAIDIGSGGGSPALPLKLLSPGLRMVLVESRERKSSFLREAARQLAVGDVTVETVRLTADGLAGWNGDADVVTMRAVRADVDMWRGIDRLLNPAGRVVWFREQSAHGQAPIGWVMKDEPLLGESVLSIARRAAA